VIRNDDCFAHNVFPLNFKINPDLKCIGTKQALQVLKRDMRHLTQRALLAQSPHLGFCQRKTSPTSGAYRQPATWVAAIPVCCILGSRHPQSALQLTIQSAGINGGSSHSGRRTFITTLANKGVSVRLLASLVRHANIATTQRYIDINEDMKRKAVELVNVL
jgi:integrase